MGIWALADLHLSFGVPDKGMDVFGPQWIGYTEKVQSEWRRLISADDLVLIPGDISWALHPEEAKVDLDWIHALPGTKVILRGNHDYWWTSLSKIEKIMPPSIHVIQNNVFNWNGVSIGGTRLWDTAEYSFNPYINFQDNPRAKKLTAKESDEKEAERIFQRELNRLELSLKGLAKDASLRIAMTHYPPIGATLEESQTSRLLERYQVDICVFGHLHNIKKELSMFGEKNGIHYYLTSCDYLDFTPIKIAE